MIMNLSFFAHLKFHVSWCCDAQPFLWTWSVWFFINILFCDHTNVDSQSQNKNPMIWEHFICFVLREINDKVLF